MTKHDLSYEQNSQVVFGECLEVLAQIAPSSIDLNYVDLPFNTGKV